MDLARALATFHGVVVMPAVGIDTDVVVKWSSIIDHCRNIVFVDDFVAIKPKCVRTVMGLPVGLNGDPMPLSRRHSSDIPESPSTLTADRSVLHASIELVPEDPNHASWHPVIAPSVCEVGDELAQVIRLRWGELPVILQAESKSVGTLATELVDCSLGLFRVETAGPVGIIDLGHLESGITLVDDIGDLPDAALVFYCLPSPA